MIKNHDIVVIDVLSVIAVVEVAVVPHDYFEKRVFPCFSSNYTQELEEKER